MTDSLLILHNKHTPLLLVPVLWGLLNKWIMVTAKGTTAEEDDSRTTTEEADGENRENQ